MDGWNADAAGARVALGDRAPIPNRPPLCSAGRPSWTLLPHCLPAIAPLGIEPRVFCSRGRRVASYTTGQRSGTANLDRPRPAGNWRVAARYSMVKTERFWSTGHRLSTSGPVQPVEMRLLHHDMEHADGGLCE